MTQSMTWLEAIETISLAELKAYPAQSTVVLTVNNRSSRRIIAALTETLNENVRALEIPAVMPWSNWLAQILTRAVFESDSYQPMQVLDSFAARALWVSVIEEVEKAESPLLDVHKAAQTAQQADLLLDDWCVFVDESERTQEYQRFELWRDAYRQKLHALALLDTNTAITQAQSLIDAKAVGLPESIVLVGFSEMSPRMSSILQALMSTGCTVNKLAIPGRSDSVIDCTLLDTHPDEWRAAAYWARQNLASNPAGRFAIISVGLDADVVHARRVLDDVLEPQAQGFVYNVAVGRALAEWPMGHAMLSWLRTFVLFSCDQQAKPRELGEALLSGYCAGHDAELGSRANLDAYWRKNEISDVSLASWRQALAKFNQLGPAWNLAFQDWQHSAERSSCTHWAERFRRSLIRLGFPGQVSQSSEAYQLSEALDALFEKFAQLTPVLGNVRAPEALSWFSRLARSSLFQPQRDPLARLDVLGLLEAEGGQWDAIWILGLSDEALPAAPNPNPFIPVAALKRSNAPRSTAERELEWAARLFNHLCSTAGSVKTSAALREGERELRPSPLISDLPRKLFDSSDKEILEKIDIEYFVDEQAPEVKSGEPIKGGTSLLETQARNPLWAFFRYRLGAAGLKPYADLPSGTLRGKYIHKVLERVWRQLQSQEALQQKIDDGSIDLLLQDIATDTALKELAPWPAVLQEMEVARDVALVRQWLDVEAGRQAFLVKDLEAKDCLDLGVIKLDMVLDRVDQLVDGAYVVIDYKSSSTLKNVLKDWNHPRPVSLQLPAYASIFLKHTQPENIAALMLVQIHSKQVHGSDGNSDSSAAGLANVEIGVSGVSLLSEQKFFVSDDWSQAMRKLQRAVSDLAAEFISGCARNESWRRDDLAYCDILPLLRMFDESEDD